MSFAASNNGWLVSTVDDQDDLDRDLCEVYNKSDRLNTLVLLCLPSDNGHELQR